MITYCDATGRICYGASELPLLFEISKVMNRSIDIKDSLNPVLELIAKNFGASRVMLSILNRENSNIFIEVAYGITPEEKAKGRYKIGEGIIGEVVKTGKPIYIENAAGDKRLADKTKVASRINKIHEHSFICVPVKTKNQVAGTLSIDIPIDKVVNFDELSKFLMIIGSQITQAVRDRRSRMEEMERLKEENRQLQNTLEGFKPANLVGNSGKMQEIYNLIQMVAETNSTVLIRGESGVGKELIADAIHYNSPRRNKKIIKVNCSALPDTLIETELFGHEKGAFTGAVAQRKGRFEMADGGTIFLDEIGDLPMPTQVKLLRTLQEKEFERVGGNTTIKVDVRIVTATNRNLEELIKKGEFREDLFYRLDVFPLYIPPLRERINDIPALADHFINKFNKNNNGNIKRISSSAIDLLMVYHWPGNIRELENCIERACILSSDGVIRSHNLPPTLQTAESSGTEMKGTLEAVLERMEKQLILDALYSTKGCILKAADVLGITERMMGTRVKKYEINPRRFKTKNAKTND